MIDIVLKIKSDKVKSLLLSENSMLYSSHGLNTVEEFIESWDKKISLATKFDIKYDSIKAITKEDAEDEILIKYKAFGGLPSEIEFSFIDKNDYNVFFSFIEKEQYFNKSQITLTPLKANFRYLLGLLLTVGATVVAYSQAIKFENGTINDTGSAKTKLFNRLVGFLGHNGVLIVGGLITCYILCKIWTRIKNPPNQTKFVRPNA